MNILEAFDLINSNLLIAKELKAQFLKKGIENELTKRDLDKPLSIDKILLLSVIYRDETELPYDLIKDCLHTKKGREILRRAFDASHPIDTEKLDVLDLDLSLAVFNECSLSEYGREMLMNSIKRIEPNESSLIGSNWWNFLLAMAYYLLEQDYTALKYFKRANEAHPRDIECDQYISDCINRLSCANYRLNFRERAQAAWLSFADQEEYFRNLFKKGLSESDLDVIYTKLNKIFKQVSPLFLVHWSFNGKKHELIFSHFSDCINLIELSYLKEQAPERVLKHWDIVIGRPARPDQILECDGIPISADDVLILVSEENKKFKISANCLALQTTGISKHEIEVLTNALIRRVLGDLVYYSYILECEILDSPLEMLCSFDSNESKAMGLRELPNYLISKGLSLDINAKFAIDMRKAAYVANKAEIGNSFWRQDIVQGLTNLPWINKGYLNEDDSGMNELLQYGIGAGFFAFHIDVPEGSNRFCTSTNIRGAFEKFMKKDYHQDVATIVGGATGLYYDYIDLIVWDFEGLVDAAKNFFKDKEIDKVYFSTFFSCAKTIVIKDDDTFPVTILTNHYLDRNSLLNSYLLEKNYKNFDIGDEKIDVDALTKEAWMTETLLRVQSITEDNKSDEHASKSKRDTAAGGYIQSFYERGGIQECVEVLILWYNMHSFSSLVDLLENLDRKVWTLKHALNVTACILCYGIHGDSLQRKRDIPRYKVDRAILHAIDLLKEYEAEGKNDARWNKFMACAFSALYGQAEKAMEYANKWAKMAPDDEDHKKLIIALKLELEQSKNNSDANYNSSSNKKEDIVCSIMLDEKCLDVEALSEVLDKTVGKVGRKLKWINRLKRIVSILGVFSRGL